ncbi:MAG: hypothetical protein WCR02_09105 [Sphaerochaetaceae bacterium]
MRKTLSLFFIGLVCTTGIFASFSSSSYKSMSIVKGEPSGKITVVAPTVSPHSDDLSIPSWLIGFYASEDGTFVFSRDNIRFTGDLSSVDMDIFFPGLRSFDLESLVDNGSVSLTEKRIWHKVEIILSTEKGDISYLFAYKGKGKIEVSKSEHRFYKEKDSSGNLKMFKSSTNGTVGMFTFVQ